MFVSIGQAAVSLGVAVSTLRRWEKEDRFHPAFRTKGGHRRYSLQQIQASFHGLDLTSSKRKIVAYARVSSHGQIHDLERQKKRLEAFCLKQGVTYEIVCDLGSGINYAKKGLSKLIRMICQGEVSELVLTHKDRLLRFGSGLLFKLCEQFDTKVTLLEESEQKSFEEELVGAVIEIITVFTSKLYGRRSHQNKKCLEAI